VAKNVETKRGERGKRLRGVARHGYRELDAPKGERAKRKAPLEKRRSGMGQRERNAAQGSKKRERAHTPQEQREVEDQRGNGWIQQQWQWQQRAREDKEVLILCARREEEETCRGRREEGSGDDVRVTTRAASVALVGRVLMLLVESS
jgi:hypothetical protein